MTEAKTMGLPWTSFKARVTVKLPSIALRKLAFLAIGILCLLSNPSFAGHGHGEAFDRSPFNEASRREAEGYHNGLYSKFFDQLVSRFQAPTADWEIDPYMFLRSARIIVNRAKQQEIRGGLIENKEGLRIPVEMFQVYREQLFAVFVNDLKLPDEIAKVMAASMEKQLVEISGVDYAKFIQLSGEVNPELKPEVFLETVDRLAKTSIVDRRFDVPYIAGYDENDKKYIFIDKDFPTEATLQGKSVPIHHLLNLHERTEKAIMDAFKTSYQSAHQIACRVEREAIRALGLTWSEYNGFYKPLIDSTAAKKITAVSERLDLRPYYSYSDEDSKVLVEEMKKVLVRDQPLAKTSLPTSHLSASAMLCRRVFQ
jgi:hypothetical protein